MLPLTAGFLISGPTSGWLSDRYGARPFATGGMLAAALSFGLLTLLPADFSYLWFALLLLMNGLATVGAPQSAITHGLTAQGVSSSAAVKVANLPPVSVIFAAFLGVNPMKSLLGSTLTTLSPAHQAAITGPSFFPNLIAEPFLRGLFHRVHLRPGHVPDRRCRLLASRGQAG